jgi:hypothetical protein
VPDGLRFAQRVLLAAISKRVPPVLPKDELIA